MLPEPLFVTLPEPLSGPVSEAVCDQKAKPGPVLFSDFVLRNVGGRSGRIVGPCGRKSGHASGSAWDWMVDASVEDDRTAAESLLTWLLKNDAEMFRRAGLAYLIWRKRVWSGYKPFWHPYDGYDQDGRCISSACRNPHIDHVHFSFSPTGAQALTSFYGWLKSGEPAVDPIAESQAVGSIGVAVVAFSVAVVLAASLVSSA